jgi:hypothetical protein
MHLWIALAYLVFGRTWRVDQDGIEDGAVAQ